MNEPQDTPSGYAFAIAAYVLWGLLPLYLKVLDHVPPFELVAHRVVWSVPLAAGLLIALRRTEDIKQALRDPAALGMAAVTAAMISVNWLIYVYAVANDQALDAAFGYYINPIFSVLMGALVLGERLDRRQWGAVVLAAAAVIVLTLEAGQVPYIALLLTLSFGLYALCKRRLPIGPNQGFLLEVLILTPFALGYIWFVAAKGEGHFATDWLLLLGSGVVTAIPLILYANGAKALQLSTIGILQYIAPTLIMLVAVFAFGEEFGRARWIAFPMLWGALILYSLSLFKNARDRSKTHA